MRWEFARRNPEGAEFMDWNCTRTEEQLSDFLEGALAAAEAAAFSSHAASCADCSKLVAQVRGLMHRIEQTPQLEVPAPLERRILDATLGPRQQTAETRGWFSWLQIIWQPRFAMGIVTVAASFVIVFHAAAGDNGRSVLNPLNLLRGANRQVHLTYARGAKMVNNLRVVYEIESRLSAQPESMSEPIAPPARPSHDGQPGPQPPANDPHEKSQAIPHPSHPSTPELAEMNWQPHFADASSDPAPRSTL
jgi:Putative zinc-finger